MTGARRPRGRSAVRYLLGYLAPHRRKLAALGACLVAATASQLAAPQLLRLFVDGVLAEAAIPALATHAVLYLALGFAAQLALLGCVYFGERIGWTVTNEIRNTLVAHCLSLDMAFHQRHGPGELAARIDGDVSSLARFFSYFVANILANCLFLVALITLLVVQSWPVGVLFLGAAIAGITVNLLVYQPAKRASSKVQEAASTLFGAIEDQYEAREDLRTSGGLPHALGVFTQTSARLLHVQRRARFLANIQWNSTTLVLGLTVCATLVLGYVLQRRGELTVGQIAMLFFYVDLLLRPLEGLPRYLDDLQRAAASIERIDELLGTRSTVTGGDRELPPGPLSVELEHVGFAYGEEPTLPDLSLAIPAGCRVGVVGRTGCGKSTLARLVARLHAPQRGAIRLGGVELREVSDASLRARVGVVTQSAHVFGATLRDNLLMFGPPVPDARLREVLEELCLGEWLAAQPQGLDTILGPHTAGSAGEIQLLALARLFLREPGLVILDEPGSRLDGATKDRIDQATARLLRERTGIIIAHRLETLRTADRILVLDGGQILEYGEREALERDASSHYHRLLTSRAAELLA